MHFVEEDSGYLVALNPGFIVYKLGNRHSYLVSLLSNIHSEVGIEPTGSPMLTVQVTHGRNWDKKEPCMAI